MKDSILFSIIIILIYIFLFINKNDLKIVKINGNDIYVQKEENFQNSANLLNSLIENMYLLRDHLVKNKNGKFKDFNKYINLLEKNFNRKRTKIYENHKNSKYTSYNVNKGEEMVFCLKCKSKNKYHSLNLLAYVAIHEMAHSACPDIGHTPLFNKIFRFFLNEAIKLNIYKYDDYSKYPVEYCGMKLYTNILN